MVERSSLREVAGFGDSGLVVMYLEAPVLKAYESGSNIRVVHKQLVPELVELQEKYLLRFPGSVQCTCRYIINITANLRGNKKIYICYQSNVLLC